MTLPAKKFAPPQGRLPALQWAMVDELEIDSSYQRSIDTRGSQLLITKIAHGWNWDLCQPLVVARRQGDDAGTHDLYVIDGQHRLAAAKLRGDIMHLPCVIVDLAGPAQEAASFVSLNQTRKKLSEVDIFIGNIARGDPEAVAINAALNQAGLVLARTSNYGGWKPGMVHNISGIQRAWRRNGARNTTAALHILSKAFPGQILQYAGTIWHGIVGVTSAEVFLDRFTRRDEFIAMLGRRSQSNWYNSILRTRGDNPHLTLVTASAQTIINAWAHTTADTAAIDVKQTAIAAPVAAKPANTKPAEQAQAFTGEKWCDQCDQRRAWPAVSTCPSKFCKLKS